MTKDFTVAVVGGGICGLALTSYLARNGVDAHLFEAAPSFQEIGAGIGFGANAIGALRGLGILDDIIAKSDEAQLTLRAFIFYAGDRKDGEELIYDYPTTEKTLGISIHRASLLDILVRALPSGSASFNKRCVEVITYDSPEGIAKIKFADGTEHEADVVIGCDGIKSSVRKSIFDSTKPTYMNTVAYRGLIPMKRLTGFAEGELDRPRMYLGIDKHIICFSVKGGTVLNVVAFCCDRSKPYGAIEQPDGLTWTSPVSPDEFAKDYDGWCPQVECIIKAIENPTKWTLYALQPPLESYCKGNIALVGDAAHAMLPHLGAGAGQGIEDAYLMGRLLTHPSTRKTNVSGVLQAYSRARVPRSNRVQTESTRAGEIWEGRGPRGPEISARKVDMEGVWEWVWHGHDFEEELQNAVQWLVSESYFG